MDSFKKWWLSWQWLLIPVFVLMTVEVWVRHNFDDMPVWYSAAEKAAEKDRIAVAFIGSSRVREGVYVPTFDKEVFTATGQCLQSINLGLGYSTAAEHYFGLRNLFASHPDNLKGLTVFIEAPGGLAVPERWDERWVNTSQPQLIVDLLRLRDLPSLWMSRGHTGDEKVHLTMRTSFGTVSAFNRRERVRASLQDGGGLAWMLSQFSNEPVTQPTEHRNVQLMGTGGTRTDTQAVSLARRLAVQWSQDMLEHESKLTDWSTTIVADTVELVHRNGGHVVFFDVPLSTPFKRVFTTPTQIANIQEFRRQASVWDAPVLIPQVQYTDDDLPDLWHARHELAERYTTALADAWTQVVPVNLNSANARTCAGR